MKTIYLTFTLFIIFLISCNNTTSINETSNNKIDTTETKQQQNTKQVVLDKKENNIITDTIKTTEIITNETSKSPCIITKIFTENNKNYIVVDYTRITDKEEEESGMPIYENKNPKLRTFLINDSTEITTFNWKKNTDNGVWKINLNEFLNNKETQISDYSKWNIEVENGIVKKLNEIYYP